MVAASPSGDGPSISTPLTLIAMKGHPATGKSAVAEALARRLRIPLIDKDDVKDHILDLSDANERAYRIMWRIAEMQLSLGLSVIAVSPLSYPDGYKRALEIATQQGARLLVVETVLDEAEWRRRLDARQPGHSTHKIGGWAAMQEMLRRYDGCWQYPIEAEHHLLLDTAQPLERCVAAVLERLKTPSQKESSL
ncbi:MAG: ATP-binding protein [Caldilinea sp.]|nr:ATP-binding protein [Caldilinea sp.]MDW8439394.1 ATP-binding protein [Caldilineaceae bacterium]